MSAARITPPTATPLTVQVTSLEALQAFVAEQSEQTGHSELLVLVAILGVLRREQELRADDQDRVARVGLVKQLAVSELRRLWAERQAARATPDTPPADTPPPNDHATTDLSEARSDAAPPEAGTEAPAP